MPNYRDFGAPTQAIEADWSSKAVGSDQWFETSDKWLTNTQPVGVNNGSGLGGVRKPGNDSQPAIDIAANEKIASDLAAVLGLPVPPVILHDRGEAALPPRFVAVSAWACEGVFTWGAAEPNMTAEQRIALCGTASAMLPFEAWIGAQDRHNPGNVLVAVKEDRSVLGYWIDYSFSLNYSWRGNVQPDCYIGPIYPPVGVVDAAAAAEVAGRIGSLPDPAIEQIVNRIPSDYLAPATSQVNLE